MKKTQFKKHLLTAIKDLAIASIAILIIFVAAKAAPPLSPYTPGETLDPACSSIDDENCTVTTPAISGANSDISSLSGLTTALSVGQGGTGLSTIASDKLLYTSALDTLATLSLDSTLGISSGILSVQGDALDWSHFDDAMTLDASTTIDMTAGDLNFDSGTLYIDNAGYVGVGTATPTRALDVNGDINFDGNLYKDGSIFDTASNTIDLFLVAGQSNALGRGVAASAPTPQSGTAYQYYDGAIIELEEPTGAGDGSAWSAFAIKYYEMTGNKVAILPTAVGGSSMSVDADRGSGNWDTIGTLYANSVAQTNEAISAFEDENYVVNFKGILWSQGEQDSTAIIDEDITIDDYTSAFETMYGNYESAFRDNIPFYIFKTGYRTSEDRDAYNSVQDAQEQFAEDYDSIHIAFREAASFVDRSMMKDTSHYTQAGYNLMGRAGAEVVAGGSEDSQWTLGGTVMELIPEVSLSIDKYIGIGVSDPSYPLHINSAIKNSVVVRDGDEGVYASFGNESENVFVNAGSAGSHNVDMILRTASSGLESEKMRITYNGKVGIGHDSPSAELEVAVSGGEISLTDSGDSYNERVSIGHSDGNGGAITLYNEQEDKYWTEDEKLDEVYAANAEEEYKGQSRYEELGAESYLEEL